ncbi:MAG: FAD-binding oxidoreductase [Planctomycetota bacterium]
MPYINDAQTRLNRTEVAEIVRPSDAAGVQKAIAEAAGRSRSVSVAGGRHAMGGQAFGTDTVHIDATALRCIEALDADAQTVRVGAGVMWPELIDWLHREQASAARPLAIRQKQTGVDAVTIGGSLGANIHGRGLRMGPIVDAAGCLLTCSRDDNAELFALTIGGYGLFGVVVSVTLRLTPRHWLRRDAEEIPIAELPTRAAERYADGYLYGDCQFAIDLAGPADEHVGIFSCYRPIDASSDWQPDRPKTGLTAEHWSKLYRLARTDKVAAFAAYRDYYLGTDGSVHASDRSQLSAAFSGYSEAVSIDAGTEMITEVYVPPEALLSLLSACRADFVRHGVDLMYGTIRLIQPDTDTFLPWAREPLACVVCNLHVEHTAEGIGKAKADFRRIIDRAIEHGGHYYLTYHRWARRDQVERCYPKLPEMLARKLAYDPELRFRSDWYDHHVALLLS